MIAKSQPSISRDTPADCRNMVLAIQELLGQTIRFEALRLGDCGLPQGSR